MAKNVYSIVLDDSVAEAVDLAAFQMRSNRSELINNILAEHLDCVTPEMRMREIFSFVQDSLDARFLLAPQSSRSTLTLKSTLDFKYRPTIKYSIDISNEFSEYLGEIRVTLRSQNPQLINTCHAFFEFWNELEKQINGYMNEYGILNLVNEKSYKRYFYITNKNADISNQQVADAMLEYITCFDKSISEWFKDGKEDKNLKIYKFYIESLSGLTALGII